MVARKPQSMMGFLQSWYQSQCDGDWEHEFGIRIETLDNPYNKTSEVNNVIEFMEKSGYAAFVFEHGKFSPRNVGIKSQNLFFFPQEHAYSN